MLPVPAIIPSIMAGRAGDWPNTRPSTTAIRSRGLVSW